MIKEYSNELCFTFDFSAKCAIMQCVIIELIKFIVLEKDWFMVFFLIILQIWN